MKLFITTCLKEFQDDVCKIFREAGIHVFSATDVIGFKDNEPKSLLQDWFASGEEKFDSIFIFSFTGDESADKGMQLIKDYNSSHQTGFPVRAFILPVESSSY